MRLASYIVLASAFGISNMVLFHRCAAASPIALTRGLLLSLLTAVVQTALFLGGMAMGDLLRYELPNNADAFARANAYVFAGLALVVALRMLWPYLRRKPRVALFNLADNRAAVAMMVVAGINLLLIGLGVGFVASLDGDFHKATWFLLLSLLLFAYWGIMLGRQKVTIRPRRWMVVATILLAGVVVAAVVNA